MSSIDVTVRTLATEYPMYTKAGNVWPKRINWSEIEVKNNTIVTHFGTFTFIKAEKVNKVWYWTLKDNNKTFRVKREQCRRNKRTPKSIEMIEEPSTFTFKYLPYQLCLPAPKDIIEEALEEISRLSIEQNKLRTWKQELDYYKAKRNIDCNHLSGRLGYIINFGKRLGFDTKSFMNKVLKMYHPDKNPNVTEEDYKIVKRMWDLRK